MKVKQLVEFLKKFDDDAIVMSCGPDGGGYDACSGPVNVAVNVNGTPYVYHNESDDTDWHLYGDV